MTFATFVHARTCTPPPPPPPPPPIKNLDSLSKNSLITNPPPLYPPRPPPPHSPRPHTPTPPPHPVQFFFLIWIICQLDSVLVYFFYKLTKNPNLKKSFCFFLCVYVCVCVCGGGGEHHVQMFKIALFKEYKCAKLF